MNREPVESSNLASVGYDPITSVLEIEFRSGAVYQYFDVPEGVFLGLMAAPSKGSFVWSDIRGYYRYARV